MLTGKVSGGAGSGISISAPFDEFTRISAPIVDNAANPVRLLKGGDGTLVLEAPLSPEMRAGFERFGFDEHEADPEPFKRRR